MLPLLLLLLLPIVVLAASAEYAHKLGELLRTSISNTTFWGEILLAELSIWSLVVSFSEKSYVQKNNTIIIL